MIDFAFCSWTTERLSDAMVALAQALGVGAYAPEEGAQQVPADLSSEKLELWIEATARGVGLEATPFAVMYAEVESVLARAAPAILLFEREPGQSTFLCLIEGSARRVALLGPDQSVHRLTITDVAQWLRQTVERSMASEVDPILDTLRVDPRRRARAKSLLIAGRMRDRSVASGFYLGYSPASSFRRDLHATRVLSKLSLLFLGYAFLYALILLGWWAMGHSALSGRIDAGWLWAWSLSVCSLIPLRAFVNWFAFDLSFSCAALLKQRLFAGACEFDAQTLRQKGLGQLLSLVLESELLESLGVGGVISGGLAVIELCVAMALLLLAANDAVLTVLLIGWLAISGGLARRFYKRKSQAAQHRQHLTEDLVETMIGHRTCLAQSSQAEWHITEDAEATRYFNLSQLADDAGALLISLMTRGWLVVAVLRLALGAVDRVALPELAAAIGGSLLAYAALRSLGAVLPQLVEGIIAWQKIRPLFQAPAARARPAAAGQIVRAADAESATTRQPILEAHELAYRYGGRQEPVLSGGSLSLSAGDRVILEGTSGSGKSTLAALLAGLREPAAGTILFHGLDQNTLGLDYWRRHIVLAPQFHENHVLSAPFAFNLLMGRRWPPSATDLADAENICGELGLDPLLQRMPSGMFQMVGEMGWQLSHGERSRLFIGRALLQQAEVVILDESFAALDPETLQRALLCVLERAKTLVVIAHP